MPCHAGIGERPLLTRIDLDTAALMRRMRSGDWYALLDGALIENLPFRLAEADMPYHCLFQPDAPFEYKRIAPYLVQCTENSQTLLNSLMTTIPEHYASFLRYRGAGEALAGHLQKMVHAGLPDGRVGVFRFQDSRVLHTLLSAISPSQVPFIWYQGVEEILLFAGENSYHSWQRPCLSESEEQNISAPFILYPEQLEALSNGYYARILEDLIYGYKDAYEGSQEELTALLTVVIDEALSCDFSYPQQILDYAAYASKHGWLHENMTEEAVAALRRRDRNAPMKLSSLDK
jgi:hypothetical protein